MLNLLWASTFIQQDNTHTHTLIVYIYTSINICLYLSALQESFQFHCHCSSILWRLLIGVFITKHTHIFPYWGPLERAAQSSELSLAAGIFFFLSLGAVVEVHAYKSATCSLTKNSRSRSGFCQTLQNSPVSSRCEVRWTAAAELQRQNRQSRQQKLWNKKKKKVILSSRQIKYFFLRVILKEVEYVVCGFVLCMDGWMDGWVT